MLNSMGVNRLIVYGREECHLCQEMITSLQALQKQIHFEFQMIDIDNDPELARLYNDRVPVLVSAAPAHEEICHYHLDVAALDAYFAKIR